MPEMTLRTVGIVRSRLTEPPSPRSAWQAVASEIEVEADLVPALDGIEEFSHIIVLWWMHRLGDTEMPLMFIPAAVPKCRSRGFSPSALRTVRTASASPLSVWLSVVITFSALRDWMPSTARR